MKKTAEILGLPVVSIMEGKELGVVSKLVIDAGNGTVCALAIDDGKWYLGAKLLTFSSILGIGESAVTINHSNDIITLASAPKYQPLLEADTQVIGTKVLTKNGRVLGKVIELNIDESGKITACDIEETSGQINSVSTNHICTFGKDVLIVNDTNEAVTKKPVEPQQPVMVTTAMEEPFNQLNLDVAYEQVYETDEISSEEANSPQKIEDKHRNFLIGKHATRRIQTDKGIIIVDQDGEITQEVIQKAKLAGKFVELSMNVE